MRSIISKILIAILLIETAFLASQNNAQYQTFAEDKLASIDVENQPKVLTQTIESDDILRIADKAADIVVSVNPLGMSSYLCPIFVWE